MNPKSDSIEEIKSELKTRWAFLHLASLLLPDLRPRSDNWAFVREIAEWIDKSEEPEMRSQAESVVGLLDESVRLTLERLRPKQHWTKIAAEHWERSRSGDVSYSNGLKYGWLAERFDCRSLGIHEDMPYHARIGIGHHAGHAAVEEEFLLRDAFFMLAQCKNALVSLEIAGAKLKNTTAPKEDYRRLSILNQNVATFGRCTVFGFYSFVECFLNSVGEDFVLRHSASLSETKRELLRGKKNDRYLSTERKIELFPSIIRNDGKKPIILSDPNQIEEPFKSFSSEVKEIRDSTTHFAISKAAIVIGPQAWEQRASKAATICLSVAQKFWAACYPERALPRYLGELNEERHTQIAQERITSLNSFESES